MTIEELRKQFTDFKTSLWKGASILVVVMIFILGTIQGCVVMYMNNNANNIVSIDKRLNKTMIENAKIEARYEAKIERLEQDNTDTKAFLVRLEEKMMAEFRRIREEKNK